MENIYNFIYEELDNNPEMTSTELHKLAEKKFNTEININTLRGRLTKYRKTKNKVDYKDNPKSSKGSNAELIIDDNGTHNSKMLLFMNKKQSKDPNFVMRAHGYNPDEWILKKMIAKAWNVYSKTDKHKVSFSSSIIVEPIDKSNDMSKLVEKLNKIKPLEFTPSKDKVTDKRMLEIPLFDMHFGISNYKHYESHMNSIIDIIKNKYDEINIIIGQDLFHNDDFRGRTSSGKEIEKVDMTKSWEDAHKFFSNIINQSSKYSNKVKVTFSKGNHDESHGWAFVKMLEALFSDYDSVEFNTEFLEHKLISYGNSVIGITHGEKANFKNLDRVFSDLYPKKWNNATSREIHTGHLHTEMTFDVFGCLIRRLPTSNMTDKWHKDNGYVGSVKRFQLFEWDKNSLKGTHYI